MIKNIIFDMGGVLIDFNPHKTFMKYFGSEEDVRSIMDVFFGKKIWTNLDLGTMNLSEVATEGLKYLPERLHRKLYDVIVNWWDEMPPFPHMYSFVKELKSKGFNVYLCSNTSFDIYDRFDSIPALSLMDGIIASCDYGIVKPDEKIYKILFDKFSLDPSECYFIDDAAPNIEGAAKVGMKGHCYSHGDLETLRNAMKTDGILI